MLDRNFEIDASLDDIHHTYRGTRARKTDRTFKIVSCESKIQTALISAAASPNEKRRRAATRRDAALERLYGGPHIATARIKDTSSRGELVADIKMSVTYFCNAEAMRASMSARDTRSSLRASKYRA